MSIPALAKATDDYGMFQIYDLITYNDGFGGFEQRYTPGAIFEGVLVLNNSIHAQEAQKNGVTGVYSLSFDVSLRLPWHTVFQKVILSGDEVIGRGSFYRVTTKDDNAPPKTASRAMQFRKVVCEEYTLPSENNQGV